MKTLFVVASAILAFAAIPAHGQHPAEIGIDGGWTSFDSDIADENAWRFGFRAGYYLLDWLELEGQTFGGRASDDVGTVSLNTTLLAAMVNGVFSARAGSVAPYGLVGVGGANVQISPGISSFSDFAGAWQLAGGARFYVTKGMGFRAELSYLREKAFDAWNGHWGLTGGVVFLFGER